MIVCSVCGKESVPVNREFICFDCYNKRSKKPQLKKKSVQFGVTPKTDSKTSP